MKKLLTRILIAIWVLLLLFMGAVAFFITNPDKAEALGAKLGGGSGISHNEIISESEVEGKPENNLLSGNVADAEPMQLIEDETEGLEENLDSLYVVPTPEELDVPENVLGRTGYEPVSGAEREIPDSEAQSLYNELSEGNAGDGLDFDPLYYPYYSMLGEKGKHLYRQIYANAMDLNPSFKPVEQDLGTLGFKNVFASVVGDHPELFWLNTSYECLYDPHGKCVEVNLSFNRTADNLDASKAEFDAAAEEILSTARNLGSDYEKEKYVHDALIDKIAYNNNAEMDQSAYSALVNGSTVCAGYSRAMQYLMQQLGIPCYYCTGYAGEDHAWNIVKLDDGYYNVDATWDDTEGGEYDYFNKSDTDYRSTHARTELSVYLPPCEGGAYSNLEESYENDEPAQEEPGNYGDYIDYIIIMNGIFAHNAYIAVL